MKETEIYNKLMLIHKEGVPTSSLFDDDEELLFPLEVGHEMFLKAQKVYLESKSFVEGIEKQLNKCIDKINKNEKSHNLLNNSKFQNNQNSSNSSSSSDDEENARVEVGQKRKTKPTTPLSASKTKRFKPPQASESDRSEREGKDSNSNNIIKDNTSSHSNNSSPIPKEEKETTTAKKEINGNGKETISNGTLVAAREKNQWILAKVNGFNNKTQKYEVIDEDEEEQKRFSVSMKDIIQLPTLSNLPTFSVGTKVLAMFPDTTTFYTAQVYQITKNKNKITHYVLHFDDDQENGQTPNRRVSPQHVIQYTK
ncbi:DUF1325 family protein [Tieghemostelium lacteum]|uniref:DUF1325 family protein n=1 Tax=Tieghemostelium lacteum TaxID=361077 RepID=A0A151ZJS5_TIELA|nr:DUF1325 family protein [Tieghemostelium lacteum]|eukprot:KYQ94252.1 DUF1325 family protein [Tieghemostelium lacteum]